MSDDSLAQSLDKLAIAITYLANSISASGSCCLSDALGKLKKPIEEKE